MRICDLRLRAPRQSTYRRGGLWKIALVRLHALGWSDTEIADALRDLSPESIRQLEQDGWTREAVRVVLQYATPFAGGEWTRWQVWYWRQPGRLDEHGLPANPRVWEIGNGPRQQIWHARNVVAAAALGWGHLVGRSDEIAEGLADRKNPDTIAADIGWTEALVRAWMRHPWDGLRPMEVNILNVLFERGVSTMRNLRAAIRRSWITRGLSWTSLLIRKGLIEMDRRGFVPVYHLAPGVRRYKCPVDRSKHDSNPTPSILSLWLDMG